MKTRLSLSILTILGLFVVAGTMRNDLSGAASGPTPRVTAITQLTHDGDRKSNLLSDDSHVFVTELPASNRVVPNVSLSGSERAEVARSFHLPLAKKHSRSRCSLTRTK